MTKLLFELRSRTAPCRGRFALETNLFPKTTNVSALRTGSPFPEESWFYEMIGLTEPL
jgi:hypothetical protein